MIKRLIKGAVIALALLLCVSLGFFLHSVLNESRSVGIIGGADGPTAILVTGSDHHHHK